MTETVIGRDIFSPDQSPARRGTGIPVKDERSMSIHLNASSTMQVAIVERVCYTIRTERERVGDFVPMTLNADG